MRNAKRSLVWVTNLAIIALVGACADGTDVPGEDMTPAVGPAAVRESLGGGASVLTSSGVLVPRWRMETNLANIARNVAVALNDPEIRGRLFDALHDSPHDEHKLHFRTLIENNGAGLRAAMVGQQGLGGLDVLARLDSVIDLEFYMPVPEHWQTWTKESDILVVSYPNDDGSLPRGYDLRGTEVGVSATTPPDIPTLVLTAVETDFSAPSAQRDQPDRLMSASVTEDPITGGRVFMNYASILDDHEPWGVGSPEFEVHAFFKQSSGQWESKICSGEGQTDDYYWNMDGTSWSGDVTLATENFIAEQGTVLEFQVWENDDNDRCTQYAGKPPRQTTQWEADYYDLSARTLKIILDYPLAGDELIKAVIDNIRPVVDYVQSQETDDFIGLLEGPQDGCWPVYGDPVFPMRDKNGMNQGWAAVDFTYGQKDPMCSTTSVELSGPSNACDSDYPSYPSQYTANAEGEGPFQYSWYVNGSMDYSSSTSTFSWSGGPIGAYEIMVTVLDQGSMIEVSDSITTHVNDC